AGGARAAPRRADPGARRRAAPRLRLARGQRLLLEHAHAAGAGVERARKGRSAGAAPRPARDADVVLHLPAPRPRVRRRLLRGAAHAGAARRVVALVREAVARGSLRAALALAPLVFCACATTATATVAAPADPSPIAERPVRHARAGNVDLAWDAVGDAHGKPLLLIMGLGLQMVAWDDAFLDALAARGFYVIRFDNRDVGLSTNFDAWGDPNPLQVFDELRKKHEVHAPYRLADMADDAAAVLDAAGVRAA